MERNEIAEALLEVAKMLAGSDTSRTAGVGDDVFTVMKPIKFRPEGATRHSLENARMIKDAGYEFVKGLYTYDKNSVGWDLQAFFRRGSEVAVHTFKGFSFGYGGEGPHGMVEFGEIFGLGLNKAKVFGDVETGLPEKGTVDLVQAFG